MTLIITATFAHRTSNNNQSQPGFRNHKTKDANLLVRASDGSFVNQNELVQHEEKIGSRANNQTKKSNVNDGAIWFWTIPALILIVALASWW
ncbi:MAG: hypothetical protein ACR2NP_02250, partial [Pirellulaceae bacterium]